MPIPYQHKRSTAAGVEPTTLQDGEIAINVAAADPKIFFKDSANTVRAFSLASYASATHSHVVADVTDFTTKANVVSVNGITGVVSISHTSVSAAAASHTHDAADVVSGTLNVARIPTIGYTALSGVPTTFAPSAHTHVAADVTNLTSVANVVSVNGVTGSVVLTNASVSAASASHTHAAADITDFAAEAAKYGPVTSVNSLTGTIVLTSLGVSAASAVHSHVAADITNLTSVANVVSVNAKTGVVSISHTDVTAASASHTHAASDVTSGTLDAARLPLATTIAAGAVIVGTGLGVSSGTVSVTYGTSAGTACQGNDSRLSDARTPTSHSHGNITNAGAIGSTANLPIITTTSGVLTTGSFGTTAATFCEGNDSRLSDTRTPTDGSVTTAKLANDAVTYSKIQNVSATDRLLGRSSAGSGDVEEITCTAFGRSLIDDADAAAARTTLSVQPTASPAFTGAATFDNTGNVVPLTVTNTGTANSFVVNDASGDTSPFVIDADGRVVIGASQASFNQDTVSIVGVLQSTGAVSNGFVVRGNVPSDATTSCSAFLSVAGTAEASFTITNLRHFLAAQGTFGSGSTVTNQYGFWALSNLTGATNNYGFYSDIASGTGRWNFYANGTAASYFGGQVQISAGSASACGVAFSGDPDTGLYSPGADQLAVSTNQTERLLIDASGNVRINGAAAATSAVGAIHLKNGTAPTASITDGVVLFAADVSNSSELRVRDEAGNTTTLSPHAFPLIPEGPSEPMAWAYYSERDGRRINVDMLRVVRLLEQLTGETLVYED